jgi:hypothetical protein
MLRIVLLVVVAMAVPATAVVGDLNRDGVVVKPWVSGH